MSIKCFFGYHSKDDTWEADGGAFEVQRCKRCKQILDQRYSRLLQERMAATQRAVQMKKGQDTIKIRTPPRVDPNRGAFNPNIEDLSQRRRRQSDGGDIVFGSAASRYDDDRRQGSYVGLGGAFGGAGASGSWADSGSSSCSSDSGSSSDSGGSCGGGSD